MHASLFSFFFMNVCVCVCEWLLNATGRQEDHPTKQPPWEPFVLVEETTNVLQVLRLSSTIIYTSRQLSDYTPTPQTATVRDRSCSLRGRGGSDRRANRGAAAPHLCAFEFPFVRRQRKFTTGDGGGRTNPRDGKRKIAAEEGKTERPMPDPNAMTMSQQSKKIMAAQQSELAHVISAAWKIPFPKDDQSISPMT